jgi:hypothetical protein
MKGGMGKGKATPGKVAAGIGKGMGKKVSAMARSGAGGAAVSGVASRKKGRY